MAVVACGPVFILLCLGITQFVLILLCLASLTLPPFTERRVWSKQQNKSLLPEVYVKQVITREIKLMTSVY